MHAPAITYSINVDTVMVIVAMNILLTGLHYLLFKLHERVKWIWPERALNVVSFLMTMIGFIVANRMPAPAGSPEVIKK